MSEFVTNCTDKIVLQMWCVLSSFLCVIIIVYLLHVATQICHSNVLWYSIALTVLSDAGFTNCKGYYTGQEKSTMKDIYKSFIENECTTLVTTSACGLTISKKDIRNVIHCHVSRDIESYYQEIGKAGMDGLSAKCTLFYCQNDTDAQEYVYGKRSDVLLLNFSAF